MLKMFCGFDQREAPGYHVFCASVIHRSSIPVSFTPLSNNGLAQGTNAFTLSRFLVPYLMGYQGGAVFVDGADMICLADVAELAEMLWEMDPKIAVSVVKHRYKTRNIRKYIGTPMESDNTDYERKNWASMMLINCFHPMWKTVNPQFLQSTSKLSVLQLKFLSDAFIGDVPKEWNVLADEGQSTEGAKILHWTAGIPAFEHYKDAPCADLWREEWKRTTSLFHT